MNGSHVVITVMSVITVVLGQQINNVNSSLYQILRSLRADADFDDIPPISEQPTTVEVDLFVNSISDVRSTSMDYWVDVFLSQRWNDTRLLRNATPSQYLSLPDSFLKKVWLPDVYFVQGIQGKIHSITDDNRVLQMNVQTGSFLLSQRLRAQLSCTMNLQYFPMDRQECEITLESWRYQSDVVKLLWMPGSNDDSANDAVDKKLTKMLPSFDIHSVQVDSICEKKYKDRGSHSCLILKLYFLRNIGFYIWDIYIPSALMVVVTWMSFWIDRKIIQGRCTLGALTMVAISSQINSVKLVLPKTSQTKAVDVWLWTCQFYVLSAFLEFGLVNLLTRRDANRKQTEATRSEKYMRTSEIGKDISEPKQEANLSDDVHSIRAQIQRSEKVTADIELTSPYKASDGEKEDDANTSHGLNAPRESQGFKMKVKVKSHKLWMQFREMESSRKVDFVSRVIFPGSFILFTAVYWSHYLSSSGYIKYLDDRPL